MKDAESKIFECLKRFEFLRCDYERIIKIFEKEDQNTSFFARPY